MIRFGEMVRLNKITTRTGDDGETGLADGARLAKTHPRIEAIGAVDEANSAIGVARARLGPEFAALDDLLAQIQNDLFDLGAELSTPEPAPDPSPEPAEAQSPAPNPAPLRITEDQVARLEAALAQLNEGLPPLRSFVLPAGAHGGAELHLARALARRAERAILAVAARGRPMRLYANRLSDFLFVAARYVNLKTGGEPLWRPGGG